MATPSPANIPLPQSDDTRYFNTPSVASTSPPHQDYSTEDEATPTLRPRPGPPYTGRPPVANIFQNMNTPTMTPFKALGPQDMDNTPMGRPGGRGGKYHPGAASRRDSDRRGSSIGSVIRHSSSQPSQSSSSEASDGEGGESEDRFDNMEYEDLDRTVALNLATPVQRTIQEYPRSSRSQRASRRASIAQTPAKTSRADFNFDEFADTFKLGHSLDLNTPAFTNSNVEPSMFDDEIANFNYLSAASPQKLNSINGSSSANPFKLPDDNSLLSIQLREKDAKIRALESMLASQGQSFEEFLEFSPEKKAKTNPNADENQLTVKKRRQSPIKLPPPPPPSTARKSSRRNSRSPVKAFVGMFENIATATPVKEGLLTVEEKSIERRRRTTQEFREFSAIDLDMLKNYLPQPTPNKTTQQTVVATETIAEESTMEMDIPEFNSKTDGSPKEKDTQDQTKNTEPSRRATSLEPTNSTSLAPPSPTRRSHHRRSNSAPAIPAVTDSEAQTSLETFSTTLDLETTVAILQARIHQLEEQLNAASAQLQNFTTALTGERRARLAAEETCEFMQVERRFGVCCQFSKASGKTEPEAAATIPLPGSPTDSIVSHATTTITDDQQRPRSRMTSEPPRSRLGTYTGLGKRRNREEERGKKPLVPRQEKRVLSAGIAAGNMLLGQASSSIAGGAKKPPVPTVAAAAVKGYQTGAVRNIGATTTAHQGPLTRSGLARGARR